MPHGTLEWNLALLQEAMHLSVEEVRAYFTDAARFLHAGTAIDA
jgi:hypothetical protein